jgi:CRP/FNR family transcriptional regulator/CRP/FNR family cyclic AMP-dependent transcriptional regulator
VSIGAGRWSARSPLERLAATGHGGHTAAVIRHAEAGELIVAQGDEDANMFIVQSGCVEVRRRVGDQVVVHGRLERGDFFGEMSLLESQPRAADVVAVEPTVLVELGAGALLLRIRRDPTLAVEMLQKLSRRIRDLNEGLAGVTTRPDTVVVLEDV